jgi:two-component system phosphate regulon response regulator PhoB
MAETILVVDDERDILDLLTHVFEREGYRTLAAVDGKAALEMARLEPPSLMILDWMLPEVSGVDVLKLLRASPSTGGVPVILLTARGDEIDRVLAFELGADDYVTKPFSPREVVLRARAVLRRGGRGRLGASDGAALKAGPIEMDPDNYRVWVGGEPLALTVTEFKLLSDLVRARGRVRTRNRLLSEVWGYDAEVFSRTVDTHIRRLRDKLGAAAPWLETVRGVGYRIREPEAN